MLLQLAAAVRQLSQARNIVTQSILPFWTIGSLGAVLLTLAFSDRGCSRFYYLKQRCSNPDEACGKPPNPLEV